VDEPRRRRGPRNQRETLRRLTAGAALGAAALTTLLFVQTSLAPAGENPSPAPGATPIAVSGGS